MGFVLLLVLLPLGGLMIKYFHYRWNFDLTHLPHESMNPADLETYTDKFYYEPGDTILFHIHSETQFCQLQIQRILPGYQFENIWAYGFGIRKQALRDDAAENGCDWEVNYKVPIGEQFKPGYYRTRLYSLDSTVKEGYSVFLVGDGKPDKEVVIFAPVSTWQAYNKYGGKSLYVNFPGLETVYYVSSQRPTSNLEFGVSLVGTDVPVEAGIFGWFSSHYETTVLPDYFLEMPEKIPSAKIYVLAGHCEYVSEKMYNQLEKAVNEGVSLISLGGNQIYWKTKWNEDYSQMECRKDLSFFSFGDPGGKWRHNMRQEEGLLGVRFDEKGIGTYAPYEVMDANHWLFNGLKVKNGDLFGQKGMNDLALSGNETDKQGWRTPSDFVLLAKGKNPEFGRENELFWKGDDPYWDGKGGGEIVFRELKNGAGILSTGSIQSGSGMGYDAVMTGLLQNFCDKYAGKKELESHLEGN